jgi:hypothetical protein
MKNPANGNIIAANTVEFFPLTKNQALLKC